MRFLLIKINIKIEMNVKYFNYCYLVNSNCLTNCVFYVINRGLSGE